MSLSNRVLKAQERETYIINSLLKEGYVLVSNLAKELHVSESTIRKDLTILDKKGLLRRIHGGAMHVTELTNDIALFYENREVKNISGKQRIGRAAAERIKEGQVIAFSGGSTPLQIAHQIPYDIAFTAITNDLSIVNVLSLRPQIDIFVPGGYLRLSRISLIQENTSSILEGTEIDTVFLTVTALDIKKGATAGHIANVIYLRELIVRSKQCVVVADQSKLWNPSQIVICGWNKIDLWITDEIVPESYRQELEKYQVSIVVA